MKKYITETPKICDLTWFLLIVDLFLSFKVCWSWKPLWSRRWILFTFIQFRLCFLDALNYLHSSSIHSHFTTMVNDSQKIVKVLGISRNFGNFKNPFFFNEVLGREIMTDLILPLVSWKYVAFFCWLFRIHCTCIPMCSCIFQIVGRNVDCKNGHVPNQNYADQVFEN